MKKEIQDSQKYKIVKEYIETGIFYFPKLAGTKIKMKDFKKMFSKQTILNMYKIIENYFTGISYEMDETEN